MPDWLIEANAVVRLQEGSWMAGGRTGARFITGMHRAYDEWPNLIELVRDLVAENKRLDDVLCNIADWANWSPSARPTVEEAIVMASNALSEAQDV
jgi:hypothetical protein